MIVAQALAEAAARLARVSDTPRLDAELLLAQALGVSREALLLGGATAVPDSFAALVARRAAGEPVAYLTGRRDFWTVSLAVGPGVLVPRADSEVLIEAAVAHFATRAPARVLDLGCGPGTLLLAALDQWPRATGVGLELSAAARNYASANAARIAPGRAAIVEGDWTQPGWADGFGTFDLLLANPPYIATRDPEVAAGVAAHEPAVALYAGADGLDACRAIVPALPGLVAPGGVALIEMGWRQADAVGALLGAIGGQARLLHDLGGRPRGFAWTA